jgi:hypothetical protein
VTPFEHDNVEWLHRSYPDEPDAHGEWNGSTDAQDDELVQRLRNLKWAEVSPELRQRCWKELTARIAARDGAPESPSQPDGDRELFERHEFTRRLRLGSPNHRGALAHRIATAQVVTRPRAGHRVLALG